MKNKSVIELSSVLIVMNRYITDVSIIELPGLDLFKKGIEYTEAFGIKSSWNRLLRCPRANI